MSQQVELDKSYSGEYKVIKDIYPKGLTNVPPSMEKGILIKIQHFQVVYSPILISKKLSKGKFVAREWACDEKRLFEIMPHLEKVIGDDDSQLQADCNHEGMIYNEYTRTWSWF